MTFTTSKLTPRFGIEIKTDIQTLLSGKYAADIRTMLEEHSLVMMRGVGFTDEQQIAFGETIGQINRGVVRDEGQNGIQKITFDESENPLYAKYYIGTFCWHQDGTYDNEMPLWMSLTPRKLSQQGGETEIANTNAAYDDLPETEKTFLDTLQIVHTMEASYRDLIPHPTDEQLRDWRTFAPKTYPLVCRHRNGRKSMVIGWSATEIVGMDKNDGEVLLKRLNTWATQPQYVYHHRWTMGDMLLWDNSGAMHRAVPYATNSGRRMHRLTILGDDAVVAAA